VIRLRFSISKLMVIVGIAALNLAAVQFWSPSSEPSLFTGRLLMAIALQIGLFCLIRSRRKGYRAFGWGFLAFGVAAFVTCTYIDFLASEDSALFDLMDQYVVYAYDLLAGVCILIPDPTFRSKVRTVLLVSNNSFACHFMYDFVCFLPQLLIALIGGVLTSVAVRFSGKRHAAVSLGWPPLDRKEGNYGNQTPTDSGGTGHPQTHRGSDSVASAPGRDGCCETIRTDTADVLVRSCKVQNRTGRAVETTPASDRRARQPHSAGESVIEMWFYVWTIGARSTQKRFEPPSCPGTSVASSAPQRRWANSVAPPPAWTLGPHILARNANER
jgi:hypothetical protein